MFTGTPTHLWQVLERIRYQVEVNCSESDIESESGVQWKESRIAECDAPPGIQIAAVSQTPDERIKKAIAVQHAQRDLTRRI